MDDDQIMQPEFELQNENVYRNLSEAKQGDQQIEDEDRFYVILNTKDDYEEESDSMSLSDTESAEINQFQPFCEQKKAFRNIKSKA